VEQFLTPSVKRPAPGVETSDGVESEEELVEEMVLVDLPDQSRGLVRALDKGGGAGWSGNQTDPRFGREERQFTSSPGVLKLWVIST
jgi:hypothetical protein